MDTWQFKLVVLKSDEQVQVVSRLGSQGWEPFAVTFDETNGHLVFLRRRSQSPSASATPTVNTTRAAGTRGGILKTPGVRDPNASVIPTGSTLEDDR
jgi:hypothetical protein